MYLKKEKMRLIQISMIVLILLLIPLTFSYTNELNPKEIRKISDNGQDGYFISFEYYQEIRLIINEYQFLEDRYKLLQENYTLLKSKNL